MPDNCTDWQAATGLPPTPNQAVCSCMVSSLSCVAASNIDDTEVGSLFGLVCGYPGSPCAGISTNTTTGVYGPYSMCNSTEQLSYAFNTYYLGQKSAASACSFNGNAVVVKPAAAANSCSSVIAAATSANPASGATGGGAGAGAGAGAASSTSKKSEAGDIVFGASLGVSRFFLVGFTLLAFLSGAGMIML